MIGTPSDKEEEYIKRQELEKIKRLREQCARETAEREKKDLKELHWMRCPKCGMELAEVEFRKVVVDACFACGGMFLDKGEIENILAQEGTGTLRKIAAGLFGSK